MKVKLEENIKVSICCQAYNHDKYIAKTLDSFLEQDTNFGYEILVHEDASTDNTADILREYQKKYSNVLHVVYQTENQFLKQNTLINILFPKAKGKYIAICEGDDFWIDPLKLQKQVDFLDENPDFQMVFTNTNIVDSNNKVINKKSITNLDKSVFNHLDMPIFAPTLTRVFRNYKLSELKKINFVVDQTLTVYHSNFGKIKFIDEVTSSYRMHEKGEWSGLNKEKQFNFKIKTLFSCIDVAQKETLPNFFGIIYKNLCHAGKNNFNSYKALLKETYSLFEENKINFSLINQLKIKIIHIFLDNDLIKKRYSYYKISRKLSNSLIKSKY